MTASVDAAIFRLAGEPGLGSPVDTDRPELSGLRKGRVPGFLKLRIFYVVDESTLIVLRVVHTAQDRMAWLDE